jgi:outer membrane receptor protein involved in Fe transport
MNPPTRKLLGGLHLLLPACTLASLAGPLGGQQDSPSNPTARPASSSEVVELSPFAVQESRAEGYRRFNTSTATRVGISIADTPLNIQVISREFLDDLKIDSLNAAFDYSAGVKSSYDFSISNTGNIRIRGMPTDVIYRDGFRKYANTDLDGVDRIEVVKGPASLFFGRAEPGGIINYTSKRPQFVDATSLDLTTGSDAYYKALVDTQGEFADHQLGYRLVASGRNSDDWLQYTHWNETFVLGSVSYRPTRRLTFNVSFENSDQRRDGGPVPALVANLDYLADWQAGRLKPSQIMPGYPELYYEEWQPRIFAETGVAPQEYTGFWFPRGYNWNRNGPGSFENGKSRVYDFQMLWTIVDRLDLRVAYSGQHADFETSWFINQDPHQSPSNFGNAAPSPTYVNYGFLVAPAWRTDAGFVVPGSQADVNDVDALQADLTYTFDALGAKHTFIVSGEYANDQHRQYGFELNEAAFVAAGGIVGTYDDPGDIANWAFFPGAFGTMFRDVTDPNFVPPDFRSFISGRSPLVNVGASSESIERAVSGSYHGVYFGGRLHVLGGARHTDFAVVPLDNNGRMASPGWTKSSATTPTLGANFYLTPATILYASYSKSFKAITARNPVYENLFTGETLGGDKLGNETGEGYEFGLKVQTPDQKLTGTVSVFRLDRQGVVLADSVTNSRMEDDTEMAPRAGSMR